MGRYKIILGKIQAFSKEDSSENSTELKSPSKQKESSKNFSPSRSINYPYPLNLREMRVFYRFHFNTNPNINAQIEEMSHSCFESFTRDNKLLQSMGYHFFRRFVIDSAREFFLMGNAFLNWNCTRKIFELLDPDRVRICARPNQNLIYYHNMASLNRSRNKRLDHNFYHIARRLAPYHPLGISVITMENMANPHISNIGLERYVSQFIDAWINSGIQNFDQ